MKKIFLLLFFMLSLLIFSIKIKALEDGIYIIHSSINDNYVMDANGAVARSGTNIQLWQSNGGLSQKWIVRNLSGGYYEIKSTIDDFYSLDIYGGIFTSSSNIQLWSNNYGNNQKWVIKEEKNGYYRIVSYNNNYSIDACGLMAANGTNIQLWANNNTKSQLFRFEKIYELSQSISNGVYTISTKLDSIKVLDVYGGKLGNYKNIQLYSNNDNDTQKFYISYSGGGFDSIRPFLDIGYSLNVSGSNINSFASDCSINQSWIINDAGGGYYNIISKNGYKAVDVYGAISNNGANVGLYEYHNAHNQRFSFDKISIKGTRTIADGYYLINNDINLKKVLDVNYGIMEEKRNVEIYSNNYSLNQKWYIEYISDGYYRILCNKDNTYALQFEGNNVNIGVYKGLDNQKWIIKRGSNYFYLITNTGKILSLYNGSTINGNNINVFDFHGGNSQRFNFIMTADGISEQTLKNGIYRISTALNSELFVDVNNASKINGTNIQLWKKNYSLAQRWKIEYLNNGYYKIVSLVDLTKSMSVDYSNLNAYLYTYIPLAVNQQWIIKDVGNGYYRIISNSNNKHLTVVMGSSIGNGTNVMLWQGNGGNNQKFKFIPASEETKVIDVSEHQGEITWNDVYNTGIYGVILRIGYWQTEDFRFNEYIKEVQRLGIPYGIYMFSYASTVNGANVEANFTKSIINKYNLNPTLGIYYDIEDWYIAPDNTSNILSKDDYDRIISTYINNVSSKVGSKYKVKVYANSNYTLNRFNDYARSEVDWLADYRGYKGYTGPISLWQYTSSGKLDGINGYVDMSYLQ